MKEEKMNDGTITAKMAYIWLYESDRHGNRWSRCQKCRGCVDGYTHYPYCPYCGEKLGK